jgi:superfamily II DNA/RNA helicase
MKFSEFNFKEQLMEGIEASNYYQATPIQAQAIPPILQGRDLLAIAQTGTGKTAAFLLPLINRVLTAPNHVSGVQAMIIVPTRELAIQISQHLEGLSYFTGISSVAIYGGGDGQDFVQEKRALTMGTEFVICTPGKMMAHIKMGYVKLNTLQYLVLDEADRMLDMGFSDDIMFIISHLPKQRQNLLFSATMPPKIKTLAQTILHNPVEVSIAISKPPEKIVQQAYLLSDHQKIPLIQKLIQPNHFRSILIFCSSKLSVKQLTRDLQRAGIKAGEIHSDMEQMQREETLIQFKSRRLPVLVATDILSRGIDIDNIELIINFDLPRNGEDYVHRIGRTARADAGGTAITLVNHKDKRKFFEIEKLVNKRIEKINLLQNVPKRSTITHERNTGKNNKSEKK